MNDKLKDLIKGLSDAGIFASDVSGGFSFKEINELVQLSQDVSLLVKEAPDLKAQYLALDDASRADLHAYVASLQDFPANASVDAFIKKILEIAVAASAPVEEAVK